jgi:hypothetical protein
MDTNNPVIVLLAEKATDTETLGPVGSALAVGALMLGGYLFGKAAEEPMRDALAELRALREARKAEAARHLTEADARRDSADSAAL